MSLSYNDKIEIADNSKAAPLLAWQVNKRTEAQNRLLKKGIWAYFILLIFEGALRKWVMPGLSTPLLLIRDPIAAWIVIVAWQRQMLPSTGYLTGMVTVGIVGISLLFCLVMATSSWRCMEQGYLFSTFL